MAEIQKMNIGHSEIIDHHCFCTAKQLYSLKILISGGQDDEF